MTKALTESALTNACQRIENFALVNRAREDAERKDAVNVWLAYLGVEGERYQQLVEWLDRFLGVGWEPDVLIGVMLGLLAHEEP